MTLNIFYFTEAGQLPFYPQLKTGLITRARNPNFGYEFDQATKNIRHLPDEQFLAELLTRRYDAALFFEAGRPIGHYAFQKKKEEGELGLFSAFVEEVERGKGYGHRTMRDFIQSSRIRKVRRIWTTMGNVTPKPGTLKEDDDAVRAIIEKLAHDQQALQELRVQVFPEKGLIEFL